jgi:hypothetical protein
VSEVARASVSRWIEFERSEPGFATRVHELFEEGRHKTLATLRADGSPRISGIECTFERGDLHFGSMSGSRKLADLLRDPRFALHGPTFHTEKGREGEWPGEAKIAGQAVPEGSFASGEEESPDGEGFLCDIQEVVVTSLSPDGKRLMVEWWAPQSGLRRVERS